MAVTKEKRISKRTSVTKRKDAKYPGETLLELSFSSGTDAYQGCLVSIYVDDQGRPTIDIYRADEKIRVLVPAANLVQSAETTSPVNPLDRFTFFDEKNP